MNYSFRSFTKNINPKWKSKSRIFGQIIEEWFVNNINCDCEGIFNLQKVNQTSYDAVCNFCGKKVQIKASDKLFRPRKDETLQILGSEYQTTLSSIKNQESWDLFLISYDKTLQEVVMILKIDSKFINPECVIPRKPLSINARRAGWQGCYLKFNWIDIKKIYEKSTI